MQIRFEPSPDFPTRTLVIEYQPHTESAAVRRLEQALGPLGWVPSSPCARPEDSRVCTRFTRRGGGTAEAWTPAEADAGPGGPPDAPEPWLPHSATRPHRDTPGTRPAAPLLANRAASGSSPIRREPPRSAARPGTKPPPHPGQPPPGSGGPDQGPLCPPDRPAPGHRRAADRHHDRSCHGHPRRPEPPLGTEQIGGHRTPECR